METSICSLTISSVTLLRTGSVTSATPLKLKYQFGHLADSSLYFPYCSPLPGMTTGGLTLCRKNTASCWESSIISGRGDSGCFA
uniref:Uncharacterized protein n=1 Tax=Anguilla anguilla TaxID=7936 RepID=A0A0E9U1Y3_ANGAN